MGLSFSFVSEDQGDFDNAYKDILSAISLKVSNELIFWFFSDFTTMSGRRLRESVKQTLISNENGEFENDTHVLTAGLTNTYNT